MKILNKLVITPFVLFAIGCKHGAGTERIGQTEDTLKIDLTTADSLRENYIEETTEREQITIYEREGHRIYLEKRGNEVYSYIDSVCICHNSATYAHHPANCRYVYHAVDIRPNSNGWIMRFWLSRIDTLTFTREWVGEFAAVRFETNGFQIATARCLNYKDAPCTADEIWAIKNNFYNYDDEFNFTNDYYNDAEMSEDEYYYCDMEKYYGSELINARGFCTD